MVCRRLVFPFHLVDAIGGALSLLLKDDNWQQAGSETIYDAVEYLDRMFLGMSEVCEVIGEIKSHFLETLPDNWLACTGQTLARVDYPDLYAAIDNDLKIDADNFKIPNMRQRVPFGSNATHPVGVQGGVEEVTLAQNEMPSHSHRVWQFQNVPMLEGLGVPYPLAVTAPTLPVETGNKGGGNPHQNMPPYQTVSFAIVAK
jgi:microcystin-dependent protein